MPLDHAATPSAEAKPFLDALTELCDHYEVDAESKYIELSDPAKRVHYLTAGEGPPLLLLHGLSSTAHVWIPIFDALTDHFTVYAPDRPGRGLSTAVDYHETGFRDFGVEYVEEFLDALGIEETTVMGNSLGGFQSLGLAVDHPERVSRLCLVGAPAGLSREIPLLFRVLDLPLVGDWLFDYFKPETISEARKAYRRINVEDDSMLSDCYFRPDMLTEDLPGQRESLRSLMKILGTMQGMNPQFDLRDELSSVTIPTRFVWGTEDYFWNPEVGRAVVPQMPNAELTVLPNHGHMPWLEPGDDASSATMDFLVNE